MSDKYEILTVEDFLTVPSEKIDECLRDFKTWVEMAHAIDELCGWGSMVKTTFVWVDDGMEGVSSIQLVDSSR